MRRGEQAARNIESSIPALTDEIRKKESELRGLTRRLWFLLAAKDYLDRQAEDRMVAEEAERIANGLNHDSCD